MAFIFSQNDPFEEQINDFTLGLMIALIRPKCKQCQHCQQCQQCQQCQ